MSTEEEKIHLIESGDAQARGDIARSDYPVWGFFFLGFVANMSFDYLLQESKLFSEIFEPKYGSHAGSFHSAVTLIGQFIMLYFGTASHDTARISGGSIL
jgi:hypothetical protein